MNAIVLAGVASPELRPLAAQRVVEWRLQALYKAYPLFVCDTPVLHAIDEACVQTFHLSIVPMHACELKDLIIPEMLCF